ncbi:epithelial membrane protein 1-like [Clytia hemisphaerica]|uniref:Uncharacterized protein n=1 Tax=Clytia hemisphaerica TaxID=252671 RepID=A0A7M5X2H5_9CNID|eukprot:TCONS_00018722-protein
MKLRTEVKQRLVVFLTCSIAFIFICITIGGNVWLKSENGRSYNGLWKYCYNSKCISYRKTDQLLKASQALCILGCILALVAVLLSIIELIIDRMFLYLISATTFLSFAFMLSGVAVFTHYAQDEKLDYLTYGWTYVIAWFGVVLSLLAFILALIVERISLLEDERPHGGLTFGWKPVAQDSYVIGLHQAH